MAVDRWEYKEMDGITQNEKERSHYSRSVTVFTVLRIFRKRGRLPDVYGKLLLSVQSSRGEDSGVHFGV